jgi:hypothetical protein
MYDTLEEIDMELEDETDVPIIFQSHFNPEHKYLCTCKECGTKFFKTWEDAEAHAIKWWEKHWMEVFPPELLREAKEAEE